LIGEQQGLAGHVAATAGREMQKKQVGTLLVLALGICGCAREITRYPEELSRARPSQDKIFVASQTVPVHPDSGYERSIKLGTEFVDAGGIAQGSILKPTNAVFTVEGANMHEAYLVVKDGRLVGFYLPVEKSFSPLTESVTLPLEEKEVQK
jgi:hypothetical protein